MLILSLPDVFRGGTQYESFLAVTSQHHEIFR